MFDLDFAIGIPQLSEEQKKMEQLIIITCNTSFHFSYGMLLMVI